MKPLFRLFSRWAMGLAVVAFVLLFYFSGQSGADSSSISHNLLDILLARLPFSVNGAVYSNLHYYLRKSAHFFLFFILGLGVSGILYKKIAKHHLLIALYLIVFVAFCNEFQQLLVGTRTASLSDVVLDSAGGLAGCLCYKLLSRFFKRISHPCKSESESEIDSV